jgi:hypothetical protein
MQGHACLLSFFFFFILYFFDISSFFFSSVKFMISLQKTASALSRMKIEGIRKLEVMHRIERQSIASPFSLKTHLELFNSALAINKLQVMKDAYTRISNIYTIHPNETRRDFFETQLSMIYNIVSFDSLETRAVRTCHDPGDSWLPKADDKYAEMLRDIMPESPSLGEFNYILLFHVNRSDIMVIVFKK